MYFTKSVSVVVALAVAIDARAISVDSRGLGRSEGGAKGGLKGLLKGLKVPRGQPLELEEPCDDVAAVEDEGALAMGSEDAAAAMGYDGALGIDAAVDVDAAVGVDAAIGAGGAMGADDAAAMAEPIAAVPVAEPTAAAPVAEPTAAAPVAEPTAAAPVAEPTAAAPVAEPIAAAPMAGMDGMAAAMAAGAAAGTARAIYFLTNQDDNAIMTLPVGADGLLSSATMMPTGGKGASLIDPKTNKPVASDSLASQGAIRVVGSNLFCVNAGSNTVSMFSIDATDASVLTPVGKPAATGGDFPTSVAASKDLTTICVGHTGAAAGVSCAPFDTTSGIGAFDALRPFDLGQTNPPTGPTNGIGITFFSSDGKTLVTTVKGDPMSKGALPGFVSTFAVSADGTVGTKDTQTTPSGTAVLFGTAPIPGTNMILATDASFGSATLDLGNLADPIAATNLTNQKATCWAAISPVTQTGFVTDVAVNHMVEVNLTTGALIADAFADNANPGMIDLQTSGDKIYALAPGNGTSPCAVTVWDISGGSGSAGAVQNFEVAGADNRAMGMTFVL